MSNVKCSKWSTLWNSEWKNSFCLYACNAYWRFSFTEQTISLPKSILNTRYNYMYKYMQPNPKIKCYFYLVPKQINSPIQAHSLLVSLECIRGKKIHSQMSKRPTCHYSKTNNNNNNKKKRTKIANKNQKIIMTFPENTWNWKLSLKDRTMPSSWL